jgi:hypothetical protein
MKREDHAETKKPDYVRNGRPASGCPQVFVRHTLATRELGRRGTAAYVLPRAVRSAWAPLVAPSGRAA